MAKGKKGKAVVTPEEQALKEFTEAHKGKTLTDAQKAKKAELAEAAGKVRFVRIANKRIPRALAAIKGISALGAKGYVKTAAQVEAIVAALESAVKTAKQELGGTKESKSGFVLPGFDVPNEEKK